MDEVQRRLDELSLQRTTAKLAVFERQYKEGDKSKLFDTLVLCAEKYVLLPTWARWALVMAAHSKDDVLLADWSEVFGNLLPHVRERAQQRRSAINELMGSTIVTEVAAAREVGLPPNWDAIAKKVAAFFSDLREETITLAGKTAQGIYRREVKRMEKAYGKQFADARAGNPTRGRPPKSRK